MRLLLTGFGPFPGIPRNPSATVAKIAAASPRWRGLGHEATLAILPTTYAALDEIWQPALGAWEGDAILMLGVAGRARRCRVERRAVNRASLLKRDAERKLPALGTDPGAPAERRAKLAVPPAALALRRRGIACGVSQDAGWYLCNASYLAALGRRFPVLFVHIPKRISAGRTGLRWDARLAEAVVDLGLHLLREARLKGEAGRRP